jgi:hypothetical protein
MKQRQRMHLLMTLTLFFIVGLLSGCSGHSGVDAARTAQEVSARIEQSVDMSGMQQSDSGRLQMLYGIHPNDVADFVLYTASSNVKAEELAVIKVKTSSDTEHIKELIRQRIESQILKFKEYRPEEYHLIEKHVLKSKDNFVLFAVSKEAEKIEEAFDNFW